MSALFSALFRMVCRFLHGVDTERQSLASDPESDTNHMLEFPPVKRVINREIGNFDKHKMNFQKKTTLKKRFVKHHNPHNQLHQQLCCPRLDYN